MKILRSVHLFILPVSCPCIELIFFIKFRNKQNNQTKSINKSKNISFDHWNVDFHFISLHLFCFRYHWYTFQFLLWIPYKATTNFEKNGSSFSSNLSAPKTFCLFGVFFFCSRLGRRRCIIVFFDGEVDSSSFSSSNDWINLDASSSIASSFSVHSFNFIYLFDFVPFYHILDHHHILPGFVHFSFLNVTVSKKHLLCFGCNCCLNSILLLLLLPRQINHCSINAHFKGESKRI